MRAEGHTDHASGAPNAGAAKPLDSEDIFVTIWVYHIFLLTDINRL